MSSECIVELATYVPYVLVPEVYGKSFCVGFSSANNGNRWQGAALIVLFCSTLQKYTTRNGSFIGVRSPGSDTVNTPFVVLDALRYSANSLRVLYWLNSYLYPQQLKLEELLRDLPNLPKTIKRICRLIDSWEEVTSRVHKVRYLCWQEWAQVIPLRRHTDAARDCSRSLPKRFSERLLYELGWAVIRIGALENLPMWNAKRRETTTTGWPPREQFRKTSFMNYGNDQDELL
ncbi:hypothetical protein F5J12DRAFT_926921 [Pisolithus orientalis]|uniref:uncharacterized protein n=1 Tax=Pisolithus orientalis TaxID=936130 RepID=UPI0022240E91|nr:uncharacterized protein F5J12DRAFT_926921 [Pisolithus orientalis]KAI6009615.1 hypothetical protein F5J12DRAFT_926921 [Pisolithus orientalis]